MLRLIKLSEEPLAQLLFSSQECHVLQPFGASVSKECPFPRFWGTLACPCVVMDILGWSLLLGTPLLSLQSASFLCHSSFLRKEPNDLASFGQGVETGV